MALNESRFGILMPITETAPKRSWRTMSEFDLRRSISSLRIPGQAQNRSPTSIIIQSRLTRTARHILDVARRSLEKLMGFEPDLLLVSAGFDAYAHDPLVQITLEREDFAQFGEWLSEIDIPVAVTLEGGYSGELPELIDAFLTAWQR